MKTAKISIIALLSLMIFSLLFAGSVYAKIDTKAVVGLWLFDDGKGDTAKDSSGNGNDGALKSNPKWVDGKFGKALEFDGTASYVDCGNNDIMTMTKEITVQFWIKNNKKMAAFDDRQAVVGKHYLEYEVGIYPAGVIHTYTSDGAGNYDEGINCANAKNDWPTGEWHHLAWTLKAKHETVYVDGIKVGEFDKPHEGTKAGVHALNIGKRTEGALQLKGDVDEVLIANVAFTQADIETCMKDGLEKALGFVAVSHEGRLATYWGNIKTK
jgi:hypothetical protein